MAQPEGEFDIFADVTVKRQTPANHTHFYEVVSGFIENADVTHILPIVRVDAKDTPLLLVGVILGCLRRTDDYTSILVYPKYRLVQIATAVFASLVVHTGGTVVRVTTVDSTYIVVQFNLREKDRNMVFGIPAIYHCPRMSLLAFNLLIDPTELLLDDDDDDLAPVTVIAIARGMETVRLNPDAVRHVVIKNLF